MQEPTWSLTTTTTVGTIELRAMLKDACEEDPR